jgi:hypothetical protein
VLGVKVTLVVQLAPTARLAPHVFVWAKSPAFAPVKAMLVMLIATEPVLVMVTICGALLVPCGMVPNATLAGETVAVGIAPVPERGTVCGLPAALSVNERLALRVPAAEGVKITLMVQLALGLKLEPQLLVSEKSAAFVPVTVILVSEREETPVFVSVTGCEALGEPTAVVAKERLVGENAAMAWTPVPERATFCGEPKALSVSVSVGDAAPADAGVNVTVIVQVAPALRLEPHVLVSPNHVALAPVTAMLVKVSA